jgi:hypothetical protein
MIRMHEFIQPPTLPLPKAFLQAVLGGCQLARFHLNGWNMAD